MQPPEQQVKIEIQSPERATGRLGLPPIAALGLVSRPVLPLRRCLRGLKLPMATPALSESARRLLTAGRATERGIRITFRCLVELTDQLDGPLMIRIVDEAEGRLEDGNGFRNREVLILHKGPDPRTLQQLPVGSDAAEVGFAEKFNHQWRPSAIPSTPQGRLLRASPRRSSGR